MLNILKYFCKPQPFYPIDKWLYFKQAYRVNSVKPEQQFDWQDLQQQAIVAYHIFSHIKQLSQKPTLTFNKQSIIDKIMLKAHLWNSGQGNENDGKNWILKQQNFQKVWQGFDDNIGAKVDLRIWCQKRFRQIALGNRIILMPSFITGKIFTQLSKLQMNNLNDTQQKIYQKNKIIFKDRFVIAGQKGTGKSFAYLIYDYLAKFILTYRTTQSYLVQQRSKRLFHFAPKQDFKTIKKLFYFPLKQRQTLSSTLNHFAIQGQTNILYKADEDLNMKMFKSLLQKIMVNSRAKNDIQAFCIIDQFNFYYSCFRRMLKINKKNEKTEKTEQQKQILNALQFHSIAIKNIAKQFQYIVFNSSQTIQGKLIKQWNLGSNGPKYFDLYDHGSTTKLDFYIKYTQHLDSYEGKKFLYELFWKEFRLNHFNLNKISNLAKINQLKKIFQDNFGLSKQFISSSSNIQQNSLVKQLVQWEIDVRHLDIRSVISNDNKLEQIEQLLTIVEKQDLSQSQTIKTIQNKLQKIKKRIQEVRYEQIEQRFTAYYNKSVNDRIDIARFRVICFINESAYLAKQNLRQENSEKLKQKEKKRYKVEVDFQVLLDSLTTKNEDGQLIYNLEYSDVEKQILTFIEQIGIGYRVKSKKCIFIISPTLLQKMTQLIDQDFTKYSASQLDLLLRKIRQTRLLGNHIDAIYYKFFDLNFNFKFFINKFVQKGIQKRENITQYDIITSIRFLTRKVSPKLKIPKKKASQKEENQLEVSPKLKIPKKKASQKEEDQLPQTERYFNQLIFNQYLQPKDNQINLPEQFEYLLKASIKHNGKYVLGYPVYANNDFAFNNPRFDFVLIKAYKQAHEPKQKMRYYIHFFDIGLGKISEKSRDIKKIQLLLLIQQFKNMKDFQNIPQQNVEFKHIILAPKIQASFFQNKMLERKGQKALNKVMQTYLNEKPLSLKFKEKSQDKQKKEEVQYGFKMTYEIRFANYDMKQAHIRIPSSKNIENLLFMTIKKILEELKVEEKDEQGMIKQKKKNKKRA